jgi:hypothetical protein
LVALPGRLAVGDVDREALGVLDAGAQQALGDLPGAPPAGVPGVQVDVLAGAGEPPDAVLQQDRAPGVEAVGGDGVGFDDDGGSCRAQVVDQAVDQRR